jgi:sugar lactone lactonase YvrE
MNDVRFAFAVQTYKHIEPLRWGSLSQLLAMLQTSLLSICVLGMPCFCVPAKAQDIDSNAEIRTVAGNGTDWGLPFGVSADSAGYVYFSVNNFNIVRQIASEIITTVAGTGQYGYSGDDGSALTANLAGPEGVIVDVDHNLYIADGGNNVIRKVATNGIITTVAGNGTEGYSGDGGQATNAELRNPTALAIDSFGNLFIADTGNHSIRKVATDGIITTVAGIGTPGYYGDTGPATKAQLTSPEGLTLDATGNLYIADTFNHRIRKVAIDGNITTIAGNGSPGYSGDGGSATVSELNAPTSVALDAAGNLYIADANNNRIRRCAKNGTISTVVGNGLAGYSGDGGPSKSASLNSPIGIAFDAAGHLYIADYLNERVREVLPNEIFEGAFE